MTIRETIKNKITNMTDKNLIKGFLDKDISIINNNPRFENFTYEHFITKNYHFYIYEGGMWKAPKMNLELIIGRDHALIYNTKTKQFKEFTIR